MPSEEIASRIKALKSRIDALPASTDTEQRRQSFAELEEAMKSADSSGDAAVLQEALRKMESLESALEPNQQNLGLPKVLRKVGSWWNFLLVVALLFVAVMLWYAIRSQGPQTFQTVEGGRALLLIALTIAFVVYGGALIVYPMFASGPVSRRFRYSREVFLMLSGIFSTIVGFYFAQTNQSGGNFELMAIAIETPNGSELTVFGGTPPYKIEVTKPGGTPEQHSLGSFGTVAIQLPSGQSIFNIVDAQQRSKSISFTKK